MRFFAVFRSGAVKQEPETAAKRELGRVGDRMVRETRGGGGEADEGKGAFGGCWSWPEVVDQRILDLEWAYLKTKRTVKAKASGTKLILGMISSSGFQSRERLRGAF